MTAPADDDAWISRLNCVGHLASSVGDAALCLEVLTGESHAGRREPTVIGTTVDCGYAPVDPEVRSGFQRALERLASGGLELSAAEPPSVSPLPFIVPMLESEVYDAFADVLAGEHGLSKETIGVATRRAHHRREYVRALREPRRFEERWREFFEEWDVLLAPTTQVVAFSRGVFGLIDRRPRD